MVLKLKESYKGIGGLLCVRKNVNAKKQSNVIEIIMHLRMHFQISNTPQQKHSQYDTLDS